MKPEVRRKKLKDAETIIRKALLIKLFAAGDVVMATPVAEAIANENYQVSWLVGEWSAELLNGNPFVHKIFNFPDKMFYDASIFRKISLLKMLRKEKFDVVVALHDHVLVKRFAQWLGARQTLFLRKENGANARQSQKYFDALSPLGIHGSVPSPKIFLSDNEIERARAFLQENGIAESNFVVAMAPGGGMNPKTTFLLKRWGEEKYRELADKLIRKNKTKIILVGHKNESILCESVRADHPDALVNAAGKFTLREMAACLKFCHLFIGGDSAPAHIASALEIPSVVVFGPTNPDAWKPSGAPLRIAKENYPCMPCYKDDGYFPSCPYDHRCMQTLSADKVFSDCEQIISRTVTNTA